MITRKAVLVGGVPIDTSNFDFSDHSSNVKSVETANIALIVLVGLFVGLRLFVRAFIVRKIFLDDVLILIATAFTIALAAICIAATHHGLGTHVWLIPVATVFETVKSCIQYLFICQVLYACAIAFTKIAIIASYLRFIQDQKFHIAMYATAVVIVGLWFTGVFVTVFQCSPVAAAWDFTISNRKCIEFVDYLYASSAVTIATDIILCVLPWPYLWKLHMPRKQRVILCLLFGGGAGACIASIIRLVNLDTLRSMDVTSLGATYLPFLIYECVPCLNLSVIECSLGIICVSIPPLRPLAVRLWPKGMRTHRSSSSVTPLQNLSLSKRYPKQRNSRNCSGNAHEPETESSVDEDESSRDIESAGEPTDNPRDMPELPNKEMEMQKHSCASGDGSG